jgi:acetolactate synthase-1/3 small subunit
VENSFTVGLIVNNRHGVLNRIAGMYGKRGYNIDSLSVGETENPAFSRMTIVSTGDAYTRDQVVKQLNKLYDVRLAVLLEAADSISVEHLLIKLKTNGGGNGAIMALINDYSGKVINIGEGFVVADLTGSPDKIQAFIEKCIPHGILELCRSGALSIASGTQNILNVTNIQGEE